MRTKKTILKFICKNSMKDYFEEGKEYFGYKNKVGFHIYFKKGHLHHFNENGKLFHDHFYSMEEMKNMKRTELIDKMLNNKNDKNDILELIYKNKNVLCIY